MSNENIELAAQCWCDDETSHIKMNPPLAMAFSKRLDDKDKKIAELKRENKQLHTLLGPNKPFFKET